MLRGTKRPLLAFEDDDGAESQTLTPDAKMFKGLTTPPASPEKQQRKYIGVGVRQPFEAVSSSVTNIDTTEEAHEDLKPKRLAFGSEPLTSKTKSLLQQSSVATCENSWLVTRESEYRDIIEFLQGSIGMKDSNENSLYITGPPGTGKTAQLDIILRDKFQEIVLGPARATLPKHDSDLTNVSYFETQPDVFQPVAVAKINCIALAKPETIFQKLITEFTNTRSPAFHTGASSTVKTLEEFCRSKPSTHFVMILDEMDKLINGNGSGASKTKTILDLFLLAKEPSINVTVIGIANSIDLKDRFLNGLNLQKELLPKVIHFRPYNSDQMFEIVKQKLSVFPQCFELFQPMAIRFATTKCSGSTGDLRRLFDLLRSSVQLFELDSLKSNAVSNVGSKRKVTIAHVAKAVSKFMGSATTRARIGPLNIQHKIVLCSLVHRERFDLHQCICTIDEAYDYYVKLLRRTEVMKPLSKTEFLESCNSLQTCGVVIIDFSRKRNIQSASQKTIKSSVIEAELQEEISKIELLKRLL